ncbi:MAG: hypothetical protein LC624_02990 [Halobacteriales archaeon]|nr:hypothetical protein [Halobacteriales archaeon]
MRAMRAGSEPAEPSRGLAPPLLHRYAFRAASIGRIAGQLMSSSPAPAATPGQAPNSAPMMPATKPSQATTQAALAVARCRGSTPRCVSRLHREREEADEDDDGVE